MMVYTFGLDEMLTKVNILKEELTFNWVGCPIEHNSSRLKCLERVYPGNKIEERSDFQPLRQRAGLLPLEVRALDRTPSLVSPPEIGPAAR